MAKTAASEGIGDARNPSPLESPLRLKAWVQRSRTPVEPAVRNSAAQYQAPLLYCLW